MMAKSQGEQAVEPSRTSLYNPYFGPFPVLLGSYHCEMNTPNGTCPPDMAWPGDPTYPAGLVRMPNTCCLTHVHCRAQWRSYQAN